MREAPLSRILYL